MKTIIITLVSLFFYFNIFAVSFEYSTRFEKGEIALLAKENFKLRKAKKPRKKWQQHFVKHAERYILFGILGLTVIFTSLKLAQVIAWSWVWVLSPIWITLALLILLFIYVIIIFLTIPPPRELVPAE